MYNHLILGALLPLKTLSASDLLQSWFHCAIWHVEATQFVEDRLNEDDSVMDIDEGESARPTTFQLDKAKVPERFIWTLEKAKGLIEQLSNEGTLIYRDAKLEELVRDKLSYVETIKASLDKVLTEEFKMNKLKEYLKLVDEIENVDFTTERGRVEEKIKLLEQTSQLAKNEGRQKINVEELEELSQKVREEADSHS